MMTWLVIGGVVLGAVVMMGAGKKDTGDAKKLVADGALLVDVRTPGEFASGHVQGAVNIPVDQVQARLKEFGAKDKPVVLYCRSGARSASAARTLAAAGYTKVVDVGPMPAW